MKKSKIILAMLLVVFTCYSSKVAAESNDEQTNVCKYVENEFGELTYVCCEYSDEQANTYSICTPDCWSGDY